MKQQRRSLARPLPDTTDRTHSASLEVRNATRNRLQPGARSGIAASEREEWEQSCLRALARGASSP
jgi:hypothetical protein